MLLTRSTVLTGVLLAGPLFFATPAMAAPIHVSDYTRVVLKGFNGRLQIQWEPKPESVSDPINRVVIMTKDGDPILTFDITNNEVSEQQLAQTVEAILAQPDLELDGAQNALYALWSYSENPDPQIGSILDTLELGIREEDGEWSVHSKGGKELSRIDGGSEASMGQTMDGIADAVNARNAQKPTKDLKGALSSARDSIYQYSEELEPFYKTFVEKNKDAGLSDSQANEVAFKEQARRDLFWDLVSEVESKGVLSNSRSVISFEKIAEVFKDHGIEIILTRDFGDDRSLEKGAGELNEYTVIDFNADTILASGLKGGKFSQGTGKGKALYLEASSLVSLDDQLGEIPQALHDDLSDELSEEVKVSAEYREAVEDVVADKGQTQDPDPDKGGGEKMGSSSEGS